MLDFSIRQLAKQLWDQHWRDIEERILYELSSHHQQHEPGGSDQIRIPVEFLRNFKLTDPGDGYPSHGDLLSYVRVNEYRHGDYWTNAISTGGGGAHSAHMVVPIPITTMPPGPKNKTLATETVFAINILSDVEVSGTVNVVGGDLIKAFNFPAGGGEIDDDVLAISYPADSRLGITILTVGVEVGWLAVSWGIRN